MRILVINYEYPPIGGGGGVVTQDICEQIAVRGHSVTCITSHFGDLLKQVKLNGVNIIRVPVLFRDRQEIASIPSMLTYLPSSVVKALTMFNGNQFDVINTHFAIPSGPAGHFLSKLFQLPNVLSIHGGDIFDPSKRLSPHRTPLLSSTVQAMLKVADGVVAQSSDTRKNAYRYYKIDRPIDVIPLGITKPVYKPKPRSYFNFDSDDFIFCTIGRLIKRKNIDDILMILSELKSSHKFKFVIIGEGPEHSHLMQLIRQLNIVENVVMAGNVSDEEKFQILDLSDCFVSTATHEGFGLVFLEAMEFGIPVISYNRGGQNDFLIDGKTGFIVELGDRKAFIAKVYKLMNDSELYSRVSAFNTSTVQNYYIGECAEKYIDLFDETISRYRSKRKLRT